MLSCEYSPLFCMLHIGFPLQFLSAQITAATYYFRARHHIFGSKLATGQSMESYLASSVEPIGFAAGETEFISWLMIPSS